MFDTFADISACDSPNAAAPDGTVADADAVWLSGEVRQKNLLDVLASDRTRLFTQFQDDVTFLGNRPEKDPNGLDTAQGSDNDILEKFRAALNDESLSPETRTAVRSAFGLVKPAMRGGL